MIPSLIWTLLIISFVYLAITFLNLANNIRIAKASGIRYVVVPIYSYNRALMVLSRPIVAYIDKFFPNPKVISWRNLIKSNLAWKFGHKLFDQLGTDTFMTVAPGGIILYTADADVISQITTRGTDFPKPIFLYGSVDIYGKNIVSTEGASWRYHRKLTSPAFSENNNRLVWEETLDQCQAMLASWTGNAGKVKMIHGHAMRLSLNVISRAGLGRKVSWTGRTEDKENRTKGDLPSGHNMSFTYSLRYLLDHIFLVMMMPKWLLKNYPSASLRKVYESYEEWGKYMTELINSKKTAVQSETDQSTAVDIIGQLVKGRESKEGTDSRAFLTDSEVMGNIFMFMIAGHETSANTIHLCILFLALNPPIQRQVQAELDRVFGGRPISQWVYDHDLPRLLNGILGAVLNETLRLVPPVVTIPKHVASSAPQRLIVDGREVTVAPGTIIRLCLPSVHRNPKFWTHGTTQTSRDEASSPTGNSDNDLEEFKPERWLTNLEDSEPHLFTPPKGAYIPFSDGPRACLGRRFAQVEIVAALALIFSAHSVELDVGSEEGFGENELKRMSKDERKKLWMNSRERADRKWREKMTLVITLQLSGETGAVPLTVVRRGEEKYFDI